MTAWVRFAAADGLARFGKLEDGSIAEYSGDMFAGASPSERTFALAEVRLLAPCQPEKVVALWNNFHALAAKIGKQAPPHPLFFIKASSSVVGPDHPISRPASYAGKIVFEGELGIVIGKHCRNVSVEQAQRSIFGYTCVNDVTAIDILFENPDFAQWARSKSFDTFGCLGPVIATEFDWSRGNVIARLDDVERQNYSLSDMIFPPPLLVSLLSHDMSLEAGDVIACGTSLGVGSIKVGVKVEIQIEGIGSLYNTLTAQVA